MVRVEVPIPRSICVTGMEQLCPMSLTCPKQVKGMLLLKPGRAAGPLGLSDRSQ